MTNLNLSPDEQKKQHNAEVNKLLKAAEGYKGTDNIEEQLLAEAASDGYDGAIGQRLVDRVMLRLEKTESGKKGGKLGVAHNPNTQWANLVAAIRNLKYI